MSSRGRFLLYLREYLGIDEIITERTSPVWLLRELEEQARWCTACPLHAERQNPVFGWGSPFSDLVLVGEAPGAQEDRTGKPFVGKAGALLTRILEELGVNRETDLYICNILKCRPPRNRDPRPEETSACTRFLSLQLRLINPRVVVALGRFAAHWLMSGEHGAATLSRVRGGPRRSQLGFPLFITYHPSVATRRPEMARLIKEDLSRALDFLRSGS